VIQQEHKEWVDREFPGQTPEIPAFGMVEEAGELLHCLLKLEHERRWGKDPRYPDLQADLVDAIGDCGIYAISWCNASNVEFAALERYPGFVREHATSLQHAADLIVQSVQNQASVVGTAIYLTILEYIAKMHHLNMDQCIQDTWKRVKERKRCA
jgi:NTP pyrophosphatase (non-canonical NTP hydrolase)